MPETTNRTSNAVWINLAIVAAIAIVFVASLWLGQRFFSGEEVFSGADGAATDAISETGYKPWFESFFKPSGEIESGLFAMQAALGAGLLGFALGWYRCKSKLGKR